MGKKLDEMEEKIKVKSLESSFHKTQILKNIVKSEVERLPCEV